MNYKTGGTDVMKTLLVIICIFFSTFDSSAQKKIQWRGSYNTSFIFKDVTVADDSITIIKNGIKQKQKMKIEDSITLDFNGKQKKIKNNFNLPQIPTRIYMSYEVTATNMHCSINLKGAKNIDENMRMNAPDKLLFSKGIWYSEKNDQITELPFFKVHYQSTQELKLIVGYNSKKWIVIDDKTKENIGEVWTSTKLPKTLMPTSGYRPLDGAILEIVNYKTNFTSVLYQIKKIIN